ncbi:hypothetical protein SK128_013685, partial [Halocaridina rubra]
MSGKCALFIGTAALTVTLCCAMPFHGLAIGPLDSSRADDATSANMDLEEFDPSLMTYASILPQMYYPLHSSQVLKLNQGKRYHQCSTLVKYTTELTGFGILIL